MKKIILLCILAFSINAFSQVSMIGIPDSIQNVSFPNSTGQYSITNPLNHTGTAFSNPPITVSCIFNCKSDYLYFYDLGLNIPLTANITGIKVIHTRGGCNSGSFVIDTLQLAYNGSSISISKRDSTSISVTDALGSSSDNWSAVLAPAIVNSNSFGLFINTSGTGICTFGQFDVRVIVYYTNASVGVNNVIQNEKINISPNPAISAITIYSDIEFKNAEMKIMNILGETVFSQFIGKTKTATLNVEELKAGIYFIKVKEGDNFYLQKLIKQ